jgi:hypothetical protein
VPPLAAVVVAVVALATVAQRDEPSAPPAPGAFYDPPRPLPAATHGTLLRAQAIGHPPAGTRGFRILYLSRGHTGAPAALSALLLVPRRPPPPDRRDIVAFTHGTVGVARRCAVSFDPATWAQIAGLQRFIAAGDAVVVPDFEGLGTHGTVPYLVGASEAWATLDAVRATAAFGPAAASMRFAAWGPGTGGQAALFTAQQAAGYAAELELAGVAAAAPATDLRRLLKRTRDTTYGRVLSAYTLATWQRIYGLRLDDVVAPAGRRTIRQTRGTARRGATCSHATAPAAPPSPSPSTSPRAARTGSSHPPRRASSRGGCAARGPSCSTAPSAARPTRTPAGAARAPSRAGSPTASPAAPLALAVSCRYLAPCGSWVVGRAHETLCLATETVWCRKRQALDPNSSQRMREVGPMSDPRYRRAESNGDPGNLKLRSFREGDVRVIALANNFDGSTMKEVERELNGAEGTDAQVIVLDLRILEFIDSGRLKVVVITDGRHLATDTHD